jgi:hypothetical protein
VADKLPDKDKWKKGICPLCDAGHKPFRLVRKEIVLPMTCPRCLTTVKKEENGVWRCQTCKRPWSPIKVEKLEKVYVDPDSPEEDDLFSGLEPDDDQERRA